MWRRDLNFKTRSDQLMAACTQPLSEELEEIDKQNFLNLQKASKDFLSAANKIIAEQKRINYSTILKDAQDFQKKVYLAMKGCQKNTQQIILAGDKFEQNVYHFLGRTLILTYVTDKGEILFYNEKEIQSLYQTANALEGSGTITISKEQIKQRLDQVLNKKREPIKKTLKVKEDSLLNDTIDALNSQIQNLVKNKQEVYQTAIQRARETVQDDSFKNFTSESQMRFYWWQKDFNNRKLKIPSQAINKAGGTGRIAEAYVNLLVNGEPDIFTGATQLFDNQLEENLSYISRYIENENIPSIVQGDVSYQVTEENRQISVHFAVKKGSFSTANIGQYIALATSILSLQPMTAKDFEKRIFSLSEIRSFKKRLEKVIEQQSAQNINKILPVK